MDGWLDGWLVAGGWLAGRYDECHAGCCGRRWAFLYLAGHDTAR